MMRRNEVNDISNVIQCKATINPHRYFGRRIIFFTAADHGVTETIGSKNVDKGGLFKKGES